MDKSHCTESRKYLAFSNINNWKHVLIRINELSVEDVFPAHYIVSYDTIFFNFICGLFTNRQFVLEVIYSSIHALARVLKVWWVREIESYWELYIFPLRGRQLRPPQWGALNHYSHKAYLLERNLEPELINIVLHNQGDKQQQHLSYLSPSPRKT